VTIVPCDYLIDSSARTNVRRTLRSRSSLKRPCFEPRLTARLGVQPLNERLSSYVTTTGSVLGNIESSIKEPWKSTLNSVTASW